MQALKARNGVRGTIVMRVCIIVASLALLVIGKANGTVVDTGADAQRYCELLVLVAPVIENDGNF